MKCIQCATDNTLKDRTDNSGRCKNCQHPFVFEPTTMTTVKVTDPMFAKAIADLSVNDTLFFTPKQLFYLLDKRLRGKNAPAMIFAAVVSAVIFFLICLILARLSTVGQVFPLLFLGAVNYFVFYGLLKSASSQKVSSPVRQIAARCLKILGIVVLIGGTLLALVNGSFAVFFLSVVYGMFALYMGNRQQATQATIAQTFVLELEKFQEWLTSWQRTNSVSKLLPAPREAATAAIVSPDVTAYSFDRLVVTDTATLAQLLIANNFHFENNCAILSITGYPQSIFNTAMDMLRRNPNLQVFAFHDCSPKGLTLAHQLKTSDRWFNNSNVEIIDLGLFPRQVMQMPNAFIQNSATSAQAAKQYLTQYRDVLSIDEQAWIDAGNFVELESFSPQRLLQVLNRGINGSREWLNESDGGVMMIGDSHYYASDSFG